MNDKIHNINLINHSGYKTEISARIHSLISDEQIEAGGTDTGADPYELLLSSLGACKAITMRMYAERKNIPLKDISISLKHYKIPASECPDSKSKEGKIDIIDIEVGLTGDFNDEQRKRLMEIGERCPVQKTLLSEIKINTVAEKQFQEKFND